LVQAAGCENMGSNGNSRTKKERQIFFIRVILSGLIYLPKWKNGNDLDEIPPIECLILRKNYLRPIFVEN
jgi:hypothetical protein